MRFDSKNIIGRNIEIKNLFSILQSQSVVLSSHRRMGKTSLLKKMTSNFPSGFSPIFMIVEGKSNPEEFVHDLYSQLKNENLIPDDNTSRVLSWYEKNFAGLQLKDMKLPSFRLHWKEALRKIIEDLIDYQKKKKIIIMIDEFPMMLYKFIKEYNMAKEAIEMLDTLREMRQMYGDEGIRFIFCGSISINVVIETLKNDYAYAGEPINDMHIEILEAMTKDDAIELANHLISTKNINLNSTKDKTIEEICKIVDYLPFYIDLIIKELYIFDLNIDSENIVATKEKLIASAGNQGQFNHFSDRINSYYDEGIKSISLKILNWLSTQSEPVDEGTITNTIAQLQEIHLEEMKPILKKLFDDLYVERSLKNRTRYYEFKYGLLKEWWAINFG